MKKKNISEILNGYITWKKELEQIKKVMRRIYKLTCQEQQSRKYQIVKRLTLIASSDSGFKNPRPYTTDWPCN